MSLKSLLCRTLTGGADNEALTIGTSKVSIQLSTSYHKKYSIKIGIYIYINIYISNIYQTQIFRWWLFFHQTPSKHKTYSIRIGVYIDKLYYIYMYIKHKYLGYLLFFWFTIKLPPKLVLRFRRFQKKTPKVHGGPYIDATGLGPWHLANGPCQRARWSARRGTLEEKIVACLEGSSRHDLVDFHVFLVKYTLED